MIALWVALALVALVVGAGVYGAVAIMRRKTPDTRSDPGAMGLDHEEVSFRASDGVTLRGWFIPAAGGRKAVAFAHGFSGSMDPDLQYVPALHEAGYSVLMFDFRGHGRSGGRFTTMGWLERKDLAAAVQVLQHRGYEQIGLMGFSMGGAVAIMTAPLCPVVKAVVADGSYSRLSRVVAAGSRGRGVPAPLDRVMMAATLALGSIRAGVWMPRAAPIDWAPRIAPAALLLIHGDADPFTFTSEARAMFDAAREPKELWIVEGAGHRLVDAMWPAEYRGRVLAFFDQHLEAEGGS